MFRNRKRMKEKETVIEKETVQENPIESSNNSNVDSTQTKDVETAEPSESVSLIPEESQIDSLKGEIDALKNQLLRKAAEFENYKRRTENDTSLIIKFANESLIVELLSVIDDFDRSLKVGKEHPDLESFYSGVELVRAKFVKILEGRGLKRMTSLGEPFDVEYHDALLLIPKEDVKPHTIIEEIDSGYKLFDKVIRHAKVIVASDLPDQQTESSTPGDEAQNSKREEE